MDRCLSGFGISTGEKKRRAAAVERHVREPKGVPLRHRGVTGIRLEGGNGVVRNCEFRGMEVGISISEGTNLVVQGNRFTNVRDQIEVRNRTIDGNSAQP